MFRAISAFFKALGTFGVLAYIALWVALVVGWIFNIFDLIHAAFGPAPQLTLLVLLRILGIFVAPLGGILGYF